MISIFYLTRLKFMSDKAHVYNTVKTCEASVNIPGVEISLVSTDNVLKNVNTKESFFKKHNIKKRFDTVSLNDCSNCFKSNRSRIINWIKTLSVNLSLGYFLLKERKKIDIIYFRDPFIFLPIILGKYIFKKPIFFEIHAVLSSKHGQFLNKILARISTGLIVISYGLKDYYKKFNRNIMVSFCAASEPERFIIKKSKNELRKKLGLPEKKIILGYTGNLWKTGNNDSYGIEDIIEAMPLLDKNILFVGVGKKRDETKELEKLAEKLGVLDRVFFLPWVSKSKIIEYILSFDILLIPAAGGQIGNSPTKIFEYLCSERPIVAANTQAISEILFDNKNALLVDYKKPKSWMQAINTIITDKSLEVKLIKNAQKDIKNYTWGKRGEDIIIFIKKFMI